MVVAPAAGGDIPHLEYAPPRHIGSVVGIEKLQAKEFKDWFDESEKDLALNTVALFGVLEGATLDEKTDALKFIQAIKRHTFRDTNDFTSAAIELLRAHSEACSTVIGVLQAGFL